MNDWLEAEGSMAIQPKASASVAKRAYSMAMRHMSVPLKRRLRPMFGKWIERAKGLALYGDVDWGRSRAYGTVQSMVRLNQVGREPTGTVRVDQREAVLSELASKARARTFPGGEQVEIADAGGMDLDEAEEAEVLERLRGLGYVD